MPAPLLFHSSFTTHHSSFSPSFLRLKKTKTKNESHSTYPGILLPRFLFPDSPLPSYTKEGRLQTHPYTEEQTMCTFTLQSSLLLFYLLFYLLFFLPLCSLCLRGSKFFPLSIIHLILPSRTSRFGTLTKVAPSRLKILPLPFLTHQSSINCSLPASKGVGYAPLNPPLHRRIKDVYIYSPIFLSSLPPFFFSFFLRVLFASKHCRVLRLRG